MYIVFEAAGVFLNKSTGRFDHGGYGRDKAAELVARAKVSIGATVRVRPLRAEWLNRADFGRSSRHRARGQIDRGRVKTLSGPTWAQE